MCFLSASILISAYNLNSKLSASVVSEIISSLSTNCEGSNFFLLMLLLFPLHLRLLNIPSSTVLNKIK